jgi:hypothetical protein
MAGNIILDDETSVVRDAFKNITGSDFVVDTRFIDLLEKIAHYTM